jgi:AraC-like DNA-binding protein
MLLYLSFFTITISVILFIYNWKINHNTLYLSLDFILMSFVGITHYFLYYSKSRFWLAVFFNHLAPLMFLIGPLLYFYTRGVLEDKYTLTKKDWIHFVPAIISLIGTLPYLFQSFEKKLLIADSILTDIHSVNSIDVNIFYSLKFSIASRSLLCFIYLLYCIYISIQHYRIKSKDPRIPKKQYLIIYRWLVTLFTSSLIINISSAIAALRPTSTTLERNFFSNGDIYYEITGIGYFLLSSSLLLFPDILYGLPRRIEKPNTKKKKETKEVATDEDPFLDLNKRILVYLNKDKPYLKPDFNISDIALALQVPQNHVSYCIATIMNTRFTKLKSEFRIQHAIKLLSKGQSSSITIDAIGEQSGFKTRSYYYELFKKETGYTPSEYMQILKNKEADL